VKYPCFYYLSINLFTYIFILLLVNNHLQFRFTAHRSVWHIQYVSMDGRLAYLWASACPREHRQKHRVHTSSVRNSIPRSYTSNSPSNDTATCAIYRNSCATNNLKLANSRISISILLCGIYFHADQGLPALLICVEQNVKRIGRARSNTRTCWWHGCNVTPRFSAASQV
jgi:hypothetical protein